MDNSLLLSWVFLTLSRGQSYLEAAVTSWSDDFIQIGHKNAHVLCIRKCPQTTNPLNTLVGHMGIGWVFPGEMGWGCQTCATWGGDLAGLRVSPALPGWVRKFSLDTEESSPSVRVQRMRKRAGLSTLCPSLALIMEKNFFFFLKRVIVILSMQSNARYLISTLPTATSNIVLPLWFMSEQGVLMIQSTAGTP